MFCKILLVLLITFLIINDCREIRQFKKNVSEEDQETEESMFRDLIKVLGRFAKDSSSSSMSVEDIDLSDDTKEFVRRSPQPFNKVFIMKNLAPIDFMRLFSNGIPINLKTPFINIGSSMMSSSSENEKEKKFDSESSELVTTEDPAPTCPLTFADDDSSSAQELLVNDKRISSEDVKSSPEISQKDNSDDQQIMINVLMDNVDSKENEILGNEKAVVQMEEKPFNEKIEVVKKESISKPNSPERTMSTNVFTSGVLSKLSNIFSFIKNM